MAALLDRGEAAERASRRIEEIAARVHEFAGGYVGSQAQREAERLREIAALLSAGTEEPEATTPSKDDPPSALSGEPPRG